jgi:ABC-type transporter lipoprotein component MlaA
MQLQNARRCSQTLLSWRLARSLFPKNDDSRMAAEYVVPSIGTSDDDLEKFRKIYELNNFKFLCIDVANGYGEYFPEFIRKVREEFSRRYYHCRQCSIWRYDAGTHPLWCRYYQGWAGAR